MTLRILLTIGMAAILVMFDPAAVARADKAGDDFNLAVGLYRSSRWQLAADTLTMFLKENPGHPRASLARLYLGLSLSSLERFSDARSEFQAYIAAEPDSPQAADARYRLGECSYYLKDYAAAVVQLNDYLMKHAQHSLRDWAQLFLAESHNGQEQWAEAEVVLRRLLAQPPEVTILRDTQFGLGRSLEAQQKTEEALTLYQAIADDQKSGLAPRAMARIGAIQFGRQRFTESIAAYDTILARYPESPLAAFARLNGGLAAYRAKDFEAAVTRLKQVPAESSNYAQATLMAAVSLRELGRLDEARSSLNAALKSAGDSTLAADIIFQRAQLERSDNQVAAAAQLFEDIVARWPKDVRVAECLFNATELRLELADLAAADRNWKRLAEDFPEQAVRTREQILWGRLLLAKGESEQAITTLSVAVGTAPVPDKTQPPDRIVAVGRYYLVRALFDAGRHKEVVEQTRPVLEALADPTLNDLRGMIALAAISSLDLKNYQDARSLADQFLPDSQDENQKADVIAARAVALSHLKDYLAALIDLRHLVLTFPQRSSTWSAALHAAEAATAAEAFTEAGQMYALAAENQQDPMIREAGMTGVAWSYFRAGRYTEAESSFVSLSEQFASSPDFPLAIYMRARSLEELKETDRAIAEYQSVFSRLTADTPAAVAGAELQPPLKYAFDAGRQAARILTRNQQVDAADQQWQQLVTRFPAARDLDRVLEEWAWTNVEARRFDASDRIYRRLLDQYPKSPYAGTARLSLAESEMQADRLDPALSEFEAIVAEPAYGASEKERALFHVIDIQTTRRRWKQVGESADVFLRDYTDSPLAPQVRLLAAESRLNAEQNVADALAALEQLKTLRAEVVAGTIPAEEWTERIWVVLAEAALQAKEYPEIDRVADELQQRVPNSRFQFQLHDVQGRRWKSQAPPDFAKSREYFRRVIDDATGRGTETAARCQFQIAETYVLEENYTEARKEYFRVYLTYPYEALQAQAVFQVAECELRLGDKPGAIKSLRELVDNFPQSDLVLKAKEKLRELGVDITRRATQHPRLSQGLSSYAARARN